MQKQKRWQLAVIATVLTLTVYNILPTVFFYSQPLKETISDKRAKKIIENFTSRSNALEKESVNWVNSYCKLLSIHPVSVNIDDKNPKHIKVFLSSVKDAERFKRNFDRAGSLISFIPAQLSLLSDGKESSTEPRITLLRKIPLHFEAKDLSSIFQYSLKKEATGKPTSLYRALCEDRALELAVALGGSSESALQVQTIIKNSNDPYADDVAQNVAQSILSYKNIFGENSSITKRYYASFSQCEGVDSLDFIQKFVSKLEVIKNKYHIEKLSLEESLKTAKDANNEDAYLQKIQVLSSKENTLAAAIQVINKNKTLFTTSPDPLSYTTAASLIHNQNENAFPFQTIPLGTNNPFISELVIDFANDKITLKLHEDVSEFMKKVENDKSSASAERINSLLFSEIAYLSRNTGEEILPFQKHFEIALSNLAGSRSFVAMRLGNIAEKQISQIQTSLEQHFLPTSVDLQRDVYPLLDWNTYLNSPKQQQHLSLVFFAPATYNKLPPQGFKMNSLYVIAKGFDKMLERYERDPHSEESKKFIRDFYSLQAALQKQGFVGYSGKSMGIAPEFASDFIFEARNYYHPLIGATREDFHVHGTKRYAVLEFSDLEQRILTENKIQSSLHEDLLKWRDDYNAARMQTKGLHFFDVPKPTKNVWVSNLKLSLSKYFRGDDRKILRWGLDLSGGKTVQLELRDASNKLVTNPSDIKQGVNELYSRVNKMGVSEVSIRQEGNYITLDFPGSQSLSAAELVKASSMYFHVVNEKFGRMNPTLSQAVDKFLQEVWDEAVISNRKTPEQINLIAYKHLYGGDNENGEVSPVSESAKILYANHLRLANPDSSELLRFDTALSKIAVLKGDDFSEWFGQTHPLLIVFKHHALEGSQLESIRASYDPSKGNFLSFSVKGSFFNKEGIKCDPQETLHAWTATFSKEKIAGTVNETYSHGRGWRMAVVLNGYVISAPTLDSALRDSASISGSFTQREINQLESDLKAGSLTYTPYIVSEKNVSPELGSKERINGILATISALFLVIVVMVAYYRFGGLIASIAVIINLLIMWATLVNIGATLTLASLAGLILTVGMAVDANVLVFERIREEFAVSHKISQAIHAGYKKAFSAILDSNITTIIAALILLNFDSGPIKGFAVTIIIGIFSSMFTALFLTRVYFFEWVKNPKNTALKMRSWIKTSNFSFLKYAKPTMAVSVVVIVLGTALLFKNSSTILGMDFKGGYALNLELPVSQEGHYREKAEKALKNCGRNQQELQIRELTPSSHLRIFVSRTLDQKGKAFYGMPQVVAKESTTFAYQNDPRLSWIIRSLESQGIKLSDSVLNNVDKNWTVVSGQMSDTMRNNALIGLSIALVCILFYITFRFELNYALSATLCLAHDLVFTVGAIGILHSMGVPLQIDLNTIAALMTIVGYSLNDTIIVFDRIREDLKLHKKLPMSSVIEIALNSTLSRTLLTSGTTLIVLIPMILLGGSTIFGFALVMAIGVIFGTLSSLFIAAPLMQYFARKRSPEIVEVKS